MVRLDGEFMDEPSIHFATVVEEVSEATLQVGVEDFLAIFGNEDDVVEQTMERMPTPPEHGFVGHTTIMTAQWVVLQWAIPRAEARGLRSAEQSNSLDIRTSHPICMLTKNAYEKFREIKKHPVARGA
jgi:hypothetical protein